MRNHRDRFAILAALLSLVAAGAYAENGEVAVTFVDLVAEEGKAVVVVELKNTSAAPVTSLVYGCWTEDKSNIEGGSVTGSRFIAFNTGAVEWNGELGPDARIVARGVVDGLPGDMVAMFAEQSFSCGTT